MKAKILSCAAVMALSIPAITLADNQNMSYAVGASVAQSVMETGVKLNEDSLMQGIQDTLKGKNKLSNEELENLVENFNQEAQLASQKKLEELAKTNEKESASFMAKNKGEPNVVSLPDGVQYTILSDSKSGLNPKLDDLVTVHYTGTLLDGTVFDSSYKRNSPARFPVNGVIKGWQQALTKMSVGDKWKVFIPPELAYGKNGAGSVIPPNSALIFEIELLGIGDTK